MIDLDPGSSEYGNIISTLEMPDIGDELHHFGWNACSAALCPSSPRPHVERRYLLVPGLRSSRMHVIDTKPDPRAPKIVKTIEAGQFKNRAGYTRPHTIHCGPDAIYVSALGGANGDEDGGGIMLLDCDSFDPLGAWEVDRGPQKYSYDFWWHLGHDTLLSSEWGTPAMFESASFRSACWDASTGTTCTCGISRSAATCRRSISATRTRWCSSCGRRTTRARRTGSSAWSYRSRICPRRSGCGIATAPSGQIKKVITIPAEPAEAEQLPELLKGFGAVPPLVTDINLSLDDQRLYVSCWGTGDFIQYDVTDPFNPVETGRVRLGGIASRAAHPAGGQPLTGGPQMVEVTRDGKRIYVTNWALHQLGQAVLPCGRRGMGGQARCARRRRSRRWIPTSSPRPGRTHPAPDPARGRRFVLGLVLLLVSTGDLAGIAGLGAFHGINPAMGWLFAVALALQDRSRPALVRALPPLAVGHALSVGLMVAVLVGLEATVSATTVRIAGATALAVFAFWKLVRQKHPRWVGFRVTPLELVPWSFLMASAHGAGLMLLPFLSGSSAATDPIAGIHAGLAPAALAVAVHTVAMITVAGIVAVAVYETVGVGILRSAWINVDRLWAGALLIGAGATLLA